MATASMYVHVSLYTHYAWTKPEISLLRDCVHVRRLYIDGFLAIFKWAALCTLYWVGNRLTVVTRSPCIVTTTGVLTLQRRELPCENIECFSVDLGKCFKQLNCGLLLDHKITMNWVVSCMYIIKVL